ncbi:MAG: hypothetical protein EPN38_01255 [Rhodanobacteraceae bacterium]|nr:MAG: hypothetical protein EPN38_01255 [Rhodanobacteraceae bacterium]
MFWQIFWGLSLGFARSAIIEVLIAKDAMSKLLPDGGPRSIATAGLFGAAISSCSYAAVAMARSIVRKGGNLRLFLVSSGSSRLQGRLLGVTKGSLADA